MPVSLTFVSRPILTLLFCLLYSSCVLLRAADPPNIIWIVGDDTGPELGCYGDSYAHTPNLDRLAAQGARFTRAFSHSPVCAPTRFGLITGIYPTTAGAQHMRSRLLKPPPMFTEALRKAGYHVAWPGKTDFNFDPPEGSFDSTDNWTKGELPPQPFFAYYNLPETHEGQMKNAKGYAEITAPLAPGEFHDPAKAPLPLYYPDAPGVTYYDLVTSLDYTVGRIMKLLAEKGLSDNTVILFFGDHGRPLPRAKRWVYDSGIRVPLIVRWPGQIKPGTVREDLVSFIDFAPTMLALARLAIPPEMQGQVFLGAQAAPSRKYVFAARDRMDETPDRIRCVRDERFKYIRNYHPELPYAQTIKYAEGLKSMQAWRQWNDEGRLTGPQKLFFAPTKPAEELYDLEVDPDEVNNLADNPEHEARLVELRAALDQWTKKYGDMGAIPEEELLSRGVLGPFVPKEKVGKSQQAP